MKKCFLFFVLVFPILTFAQSLSGNYVIGNSQPFPFNSLTNAVNRINNSGVSGPVVFLLDDSNYSNASENFPIKISQFSGSSSTNTLRIKPNVGKNVTITASNINGYTGVPAVFQFDGADNIILDGSNSANGSSRNFTLANNDNVSYVSRTVIWISSNSSNGANNISILNTKLQMINRNQDAQQLSGIFSGSNSLLSNNNLNGTVATAANSQMTVTNNEFLNLRQGIFINGNTNSTLRPSNINFSLNILGSTIDADKPAHAVVFTNVTDFNLTENTIVGVSKYTNGSYTLSAIEVENATNYTINRNVINDIEQNNNSVIGSAVLIKGLCTNGVFSENKISNVKNTGSGNIRAISIEMDPNTTSGLLITNNFICDVASTGTSTNTGHGIYIASGKNIRFYHNTIAMNAAQTGFSAALYFAGGTDFDVRNNIFSNTSTSGTRYAIYAAVSASAFTGINYNDYFSTPIGYLGSDRTTLANWKSATGKDINSVSIQPNFTSVTDLHLVATSNAALDNLGQPLAAVITDIDLQSRSTTAPDMGADEFSVVAALATQPTTQATALTFSNVTSNSFTVGWTNGNGARRIVMIRAGSAINSAPLDATAYTANAQYGIGSEIGTGNYVIYANTGNSVAVTGLSGSTTYHIAVYEYNGTAATANYLTNSPLVGNKATINASLGWQIANTNTINTINFDETVAGVNTGPFVGSGFAAAPSSGQLNSNAWAVAGFEGGAIAFSGTNTNPDFGRGISNGNVNLGGIYAFKTSGNNAALGVQPSADDFTPGTITLRFQNQTSAPITSVSIGYKVYILNDQPTSNSFNFSHSVNNATFTEIPELNVTSSENADVSPSWKASYRVATISGLNIPVNGFYYLKWSGDEVVTGIDYDEFALDDIVLSANPTTNFVAFEGTAENFSVHGNTSLSANTTVNGDLKFTAGKLSINSNTLTLGGNVINTVSGALKGGATANVSITGSANPTLSFDQTLLGTTNLLNNLNVLFSAPTTVLLANPVVINGSLSVSLNQTLNMGTNALTGILSSITVNGQLRTQNTSALPFPAGKTFLGSGTVVFDATASQTLVSGTYNNVTVNSPAGTTAGGAITVNGILNLAQANPNATTGSLSLGSNILTMGPSATNTGQGDVTGITTRNSIAVNTLYTFGNPNTSILFPNVGTLPTSLSLKTAIGVAPSWLPGAINRTYDFIQTGASGTKAVIKAHYLDSELNGNNENKLVDFAHIFSSNTTLEQGRSNYNTTENWIELTNVNVGLYFTNTFGQVNLTLDESVATFLTWNGSVSNSWTTATNWTPNATPSDDTAVFIPDAATTPNDPTLNPLNLLGSINIAEGGIVNAPANSQLTINRGAGAWINNGIYNAGSGTSRVIFTNLDATIAGETSFNNVTINSGGGLRPLTGNIMRIAGSFVINGNFSAAALNNTVEYSGVSQNVIVPNGFASSYHNLIISGSGAIFPSSLRVDGNLTINQAVDFSSKTLIMGGSEIQNVNGSVNPQFNNLTVNNSNGGIVLHTNTNVNGTLTLTAGNLAINDYDLTLGTNNVVGTFGVTKMIVANGTGFVRRPFTNTGSYFFPIGELSNTAAYSPISVNMTSGSFSNAFVSVSVVDETHPNNNSLQHYISRYWQVRQIGITNAIATITANYISQEVLVPEATMSAAQLTGVFNQETNPWIRFSPLNSLTLTAAGAILQPNEISYFTGIKGGDFTANVLGGGTFCENEPVTLSTSIIGGDFPYSYGWSNGLGTASTAIPPVTNIGTATYTLTVKDANGIQAVNTTSVTTIAAAIAGIISANQTVCFSYEPDAITISGNSAPIIYWERSDNSEFTNPITINNTSNTLTGAEAGEIISQTYFRAAVANGTCATVFTNAVSIDTKTTIWNGGSWSNGVPDSVTSAVISADYVFTTSLNACSLTIINDAVVEVPAGFDLTLNGALAVTSGSFTLNSDTNLIQITDESNFGDITVKRKSSALFRLDYTMWGSPLFGQQKLLNFSPLTVATRFYTLNSGSSVFQIIDPSTNGFTPGAGYLIRMPNNHISFAAGATPLQWIGNFTGIPTNGNVILPLNSAEPKLTMISNPYASMIDADRFLDDNQSEIEGTLYFWRRRNYIDNGTEPNSAYYATYTSAGGAAVLATVQPFTSEIPNGFIQVGQGFLVKALNAPVTGAISFTNQMRTATNNNNQFFRSASANDKSRIWLNVTTPSGEFGQMLLAYMSSAQNTVDRTDGKYFNDGSMALTSWLDNTEYIIQGRAAFESSDVALLNFKTQSAGNYTIAIDHVDGIFSGNQNIYLRDKLTNVEHDLKNASYTFTSEVGNFNNRFEIFYDNFLSNPSQTFNPNEVIVYKESDQIVINSGLENMDSVEIYDLSGRLLLRQEHLSTSEIRCNVGPINQVLIIKIEVAGQKVSRKLIN